MSVEPIQDDPFICVLLAKLPPEISISFSDAQLQGLKQALDTQAKSTHTMRLRYTFGFWRWHFYLTLLFGKERRELSRRAQEAERMALALATLLFVTFSTLLGMMVLYLVKSAMGINIFPNFSFGIWDWFKGKYL